MRKPHRNPPTSGASDSDIQSSRIQFFDRNRGSIDQRIRRKKFIFVPHLEIMQYRADFVIFDLERSSESRIYALVLECGGHEFDERTKEQAARDRSRGRELTAYGVIVFRFTGTEIFRDPLGAADEIVTYLLRGVA